MREVFQELRFAVRRAWKTPGFTLVVVLTLGLGIGAATAIFSVADAALFRGLPFLEADRLVTVTGGVDDPSGFIARNASYPEFSDWRSDNRTLEGLAAWTPYQATLAGNEGNDLAVLDVEWVTADYFDVLGATLQAGRSFTSAEQTPEGPQAVVISHRLWRDRFGSDPGVIGAAVRLDDRVWEVVGITEPEFHGLSFSADVWFPQEAMDVVDVRDRRYLAGVGRLSPGSSVAAASDDLKAIAAGLEETYPDTHANRTVEVALLRASLLGLTGDLLIVLLAAVGGLLLIACVNVTNLILVRFAARERAILVRRALGASSRRVVLQAQADTLVLAVAGAVVGCVLASVGVDVLRALIPPEVLPGYVETGVDPRAMLFAVAVALAAGIVIGIVPALRSFRTDPASGLREGGAATGGRRHSSILQPALVTAELAMALVLLIATGLMVRDLEARLEVDTGMDVERVLAFRVDIPEESVSGEEIEPFLRTVAAEIEAVSSVERAAWLSDIPFSNDNTATSVALEGVETPDDLVRVYIHRFSPDAFEALGVSLLSGRQIGEDDDLLEDPVVVISSTLARQYYGDLDPIGRRITFGSTTVRIVGVAEDVRYRDLTSDLATGTDPDVYLGYYQSLPPSSVGFVVRTQGEPAMAMEDVREAASAALAGIPIQNLAPLSDGIRNVTALSRFGSTLFAVFGILAGTLAAVGIYGVIAVSVGLRRQEIAIRMALGADAPKVLGLVMRQGALLAAVGLGIGLVGAVAVSRSLEAFLFGVSTVDPMTYGGAAATVLFVAFAATWIPAARAARVEPIQALRAD